MQGKREIRKRPIKARVHIPIKRNLDDFIVDDDFDERSHNAKSLLSVSRAARRKFDLPTPQITIVEDYKNFIKPSFKRNAPFIRHSVTYDQKKQRVEYFCTKEDFSWLMQHPKGLQPDAHGFRISIDVFETIIDRLERASATEQVIPQYIAIDVAHRVCTTWSRSEVQRVMSELYPYWIQKREKLRKPLLRRFWPATACGNPDPHQVFRPRDKEQGGYRLRKNRQGQHENLLRLSQLHGQLLHAKELLQMPLHRERLKQHCVNIQRQKFLMQVQMVRKHPQIPLPKSPPVSLENLECPELRKLPQVLNPFEMDESLSPNPQSNPMEQEPAVAKTKAKKRTRKASVSAAPVDHDAWTEQQQSGISSGRGGVPPHHTSRGGARPPPGQTERFTGPQIRRAVLWGDVKLGEKTLSEEFALLPTRPEPDRQHYPSFPKTNRKDNIVSSKQRRPLFNFSFRHRMSSSNNIKWPHSLEDGIRTMEVSGKKVTDSNKKDISTTTTTVATTTTTRKSNKASSSSSSSSLLTSLTSSQSSSSTNVSRRPTFSGRGRIGRGGRLIIDRRSALISRTPLSVDRLFTTSIPSNTLVQPRMKSLFSLYYKDAVKKILTPPKQLASSIKKSILSGGGKVGRNPIPSSTNKIAESAMLPNFTGQLPKIPESSTLSTPQLAQLPDLGGATSQNGINIGLDPISLATSVKEESPLLNVDEGSPKRKRSRHMPEEITIPNLDVGLLTSTSLSSALSTGRTPQSDDFPLPINDGDSTNNSNNRRSTAIGSSSLTQDSVFNSSSSIRLLQEHQNQQQMEILKHLTPTTTTATSSCDRSQKAWNMKLEKEIISISNEGQITTVKKKKDNKTNDVKDKSILSSKDFVYNPLLDSLVIPPPLPSTLDPRYLDNTESKIPLVQRQQHSSPKIPDDEKFTAFTTQTDFEKSINMRKINEIYCRSDSEEEDNTPCGCLNSVGVALLPGGENSVKFKFNI
eukprot:TRINITY_DN1162_c0_g5_i1.p1 TRINITY_DN1162_c0_g5~~TRINITY_DN1162_c0_g5_i1.p1  ORF type:complete len:973 (-),score=260.56 TRINITY_DN1162_c0_g5_i1:278-3196(-)